MGKFGQPNSAKDWVRMAAKLSLLFTEPKVRKAVGDRVRSTVDDISDTVAGKYSDVSDTVSDRYQDAVDRLEAASDALQGKSSWPSSLTGFLLGVGVGAAVGILLAPASGEETRDSIRGRAVDWKNQMFDAADSATSKGRQSVASMNTEM